MKKSDQFPETSETPLETPLVLDGRYVSDIHPCVSKTSRKALQACLGL